MILVRLVHLKHDTSEVIRCWRESVFFPTAVYLTVLVDKAVKLSRDSEGSSKSVSGVWEGGGRGLNIYTHSAREAE